MTWSHVCGALLQLPSLRQRLLDRLYLWRADADKLARTFTGELSGSLGLDPAPVPPLSIVMLVTGTRGDVQVHLCSVYCML